MKISSILAMLAMLAVPGTYSLQDTEQDLETALEEATELDLMDFAVPEGGHAKRAILPGIALNRDTVHVSYCYYRLIPLQLTVWTTCTLWLTRQAT